MQPMHFLFCFGLFVCLFVCSHISLIVVIELESVSGTMQRVFGWMFKRPYWNKKEKLS